MRLYAIICDYMRLYVLICYYMLLFAIKCWGWNLTLESDQCDYILHIICDYMQVYAIICVNLQLYAIICDYMLMLSRLLFSTPTKLQEKSPYT